MNTDHNLLLGILALQMDFIDRDALVASMQAWVLEKSKPLGEILQAQGHLSSQRRQLLDALVDEHLKQHGNDAQRSLAAVSTVGSVRADLKRLADPDIEASLARFPAGRGADKPSETIPLPAGAPIFAGTRFRILRPHARGGLGEVYVAQDEGLHREVALKEIQERYADNTESRSRFLLEAEITGGLEHPGIVPSEDELALARVLATRAAQLAASAVSTSAEAIPINAGEVRQQILGDDAPWVGLSELLRYCWSIGLPVLHLDHFPKSAKRPDGFAARVNGRPVIILCRHAKYSAWLLFILAHELAHLALGHVPDEGTLIDQGLDENCTDVEEQQANAFAIELLTGRPKRNFIATGRWPNASGLAEAAHTIARQSMIDPGHVVLNYAHSMGKSFFPVGLAALKLLDPHDDAVAKVRTTMAGNLDWSRLSEDSSEFLMRVTQYGHSE